jgi:tRNA-dihydrouridine synthase
MAGRAAVRSPWLFAAAKKALADPQSGAPSPALPEYVDLEELGLRFLELLTRYQPPEFHISRARRFFNYFCDNLKWGTYVKNLLNRETELNGVAKAWSAYLGERPEERSVKVAAISSPALP